MSPVIYVTARPLQRRAEALVPDDEPPAGGVGGIFGRGSKRDRVLHDLSYGVTPLRAADAGRGWIAARHVIVGLTIFAFGFVLVDIWFA